MTINNLINFIKDRYDLMHHLDTQSAKRTMYDHAFGAVSFYLTLNPDQFDAVSKVWEEWRLQFEEKIYGEI